MRDRKLEYYSEPKGKMLGSIDLSVCRVDEAAHVLSSSPLLLCQLLVPPVLR